MPAKERSPPPTPASVRPAASRRLLSLACGILTRWLSAAENVIGSIGIFLLGWLARTFIRGDQEGWLPWWLAWGGGGHFVVCGVVRVIGAVILATTPDEQLDLAETAEGEAKKD